MTTQLYAIYKDGVMCEVCMTEDKALMRLNSLHNCGASGNESYSYADVGYTCEPVVVSNPKTEVAKDALLELIRLKFKSGNGVPVERTTLTGDECKKFLVQDATKSN